MNVGSANNNMKLKPNDLFARQSGTYRVFVCLGRRNGSSGAIAETSCPYFHETAESLRSSRHYTGDDSGVGFRTPSCGTRRLVSPAMARIQDSPGIGSFGRTRRLDWKATPSNQRHRGSCGGWTVVLACWVSTRERNCAARDDKAVSARTWGYWIREARRIDPLTVRATRPIEPRTRSNALRKSAHSATQAEGGSYPQEGKQDVQYSEALTHHCPGRDLVEGVDAALLPLLEVRLAFGHLA